MKIFQNGDQLTIKTSAAAQIIMAALVALVGLGAISTKFFISSSNSSGSPWVPVVVGVMFLLGSVLLLLTARSLTVDLVKSGSSTVTQKRVLGSPKTQQFNAADVASVLTITPVGPLTIAPNSTMGNSMNNTRTMSSLSLIFKDGSTLVLAQGKSNSTGFSVNGIPLGNMIRKSPYAKPAQAIAEFLGVPVQNDNLDPLTIMKDMMGAGRQGTQPTSFNGAAPAAPTATPEEPSTITLPASPEPTASPATPVAVPLQPQVITPTQLVTPPAEPTQPSAEQKPL